MATVGSAIAPRRMNIMRSPDNPLDRTTIISIFPKPIEVINHTVFPGKFNLEAGNYERPSLLVIGGSYWLKDISQPDDRMAQYTEMKVSSMEMANSIIEDFCRGLILADTEKRPGFAFIPGDIRLEVSDDGYNYDKTLAKIKINHKNIIDGALGRQRAWFGELVSMADSFWQVSQSPRSIDSNMRMAATELNLHEGKPWMADLSKLKLENCPACGYLRNNAFPICSQCGTIVDPEKYKTLNLQKAGK